MGFCERSLPLPCLAFGGGVFCGGVKRGCSRDEFENQNQSSEFEKTRSFELPKNCTPKKKKKKEKEKKRNVWIRE